MPDDLSINHITDRVSALSGWLVTSFRWIALRIAGYGKAVKESKNSSGMTYSHPCLTRRGGVVVSRWALPLLK